MGFFSKKEKEGEQPPRQPTSKWANVAPARETDYSTYDDEEPEDYNSSEWLQNKTAKVQSQSLDSSRRALQKLRDAENIGENSLRTLAQQSGISFYKKINLKEQLSRAEGRLDDADHHIKSSHAKADEIKKLNRFFLIPSFSSEKKSKERDARLEKEHQARKQGNEGRHESVLSNSQRLRDQADNRTYQNSGGGGQRMYSTPQGLERNHIEEEIDSNLDEISSGLSRIKMMGMTMNQELGNQDVQIRKIQEKTEFADQGVTSANRKLGRMLKDKKK